MKNPAERGDVYYGMGLAALASAVFLVVFIGYVLLFGVHR